MVSIVFLLACKKETKCESWKYEDKCVAKNSLTYCTGPSSVRTGTFCGDQLDGVYPGAQKTIHEDENTKTVRKFISKE